MTTTVYPPILETIRRYAPRDYRIGHNPKSKYIMRCPVPGHDDNSASFDVSESEDVAICRSRCGGFNRVSLYRILSGEQKLISQPAKSYRQENKPRVSKGNAEPLQGATLEQVSTSKGLPADWLQRELGWRDGQYGRGRKAVPAVLMPYLDAKGKQQFQRYRVGVTSKDRFRWEVGAKMMAYGLQFLDGYDDSYVLLVEGETDFAACRYAGLQVLGIPGASAFNVAMADAIRRFDTVYLWQEPDQGGATLLAKVSSQFENLKVISSESAKDPCELSQLAGPKFRANITALMEQAITYVVPETTWVDHLDAAGKKQHQENQREAAGFEPLPEQPVTHRVPIEKINPETGQEEWLLEARAKSLLSVYIDQSTEMASRYALRGKKIDMLLFRESPKYSHVDFPVPMENRHIFPSTEQLTEWLEFADGKWEKSYSIAKAAAGIEPKRNPKVFAQETCLQNGFMTCDVHGHQYEKAGYCGGKQDPNCGSSLSGRFAKITLPELHYRITWHSKSFRVHQCGIENIGDVVNEICKLIQSATNRINTRIKARKYKNQSRLIYRTATFHMDYPVCYVHIKTVCAEEESGILDKDMDRLTAALGSDVERVWDTSTDSKQQVLLHLVGAATATLASVDRGNQLDPETCKYLFAGYWHGTKGERINSALDWLQDLVKKVPKPEKPKCEKEDCGRELHWVFDRRPRNQTTNPTSSEYAWRDPATVLHRRL